MADIYLLTSFEEREVCYQSMMQKTMAHRHKSLETTATAVFVMRNKTNASFNHALNAKIGLSKV